MDELVLKGDVGIFSTLKEYLNTNAPYTFKEVIKNLDEAIEKHRIDLAFEPIGRILRLEFNDSPSIRDQIYRKGEIDSCIAYFGDSDMGYLKHIPEMVLEIIQKLNLAESEVHVAEDFVLDAMDEGVPMMVMVIHAGKYAGTMIKFKPNQNCWVQPDDFMFGIECVPWKRYVVFSTVDEFIQQINTVMGVE